MDRCNERYREKKVGILKQIIQKELSLNCNIYLFRKKFAINYNKKDDTKYRIPLAALLSDQDIFGKYNKPVITG